VRGGLSRFVIGGVVLLAGVASPVAAGAAPAKAARARGQAPWPRDAVRHESAFIADINTLRAGRRLPPLEVHPGLTRKSRKWAATMAASRRIWHSRVSSDVNVAWRKLGENVGMGRDQSGLHAAFVASGTHLANLIDPAFRYVGLGVVASGGILYVSQVFLQPPAGVHRGTRPASVPTGPRRIRIQAIQPQPVPSAPATTPGRHFRALS
jgi:uncharacterized protein YkwD